MSKFSIRCDLCAASAKVEVTAPKGIDDRAMAMKALTEKGWRYRNGRIAKSTVTMTCPDHKEAPLVLEADSPEEAAKPDASEE